jgi:adenylylsulfate kinase
MAAIGNAAASILQTFPRQPVILDGRTFLRAYQVRDLCTLAASVNEVPRFIECTCAAEIARERLEKDLAQGGHPAGNRTYTLYLALEAAAEPLRVPRLVLDTGQVPLERCVERCLEYLKSS